MDIPSYFSIDLIQAVNDWMISPKPSVAARLDAASIQLPEFFRTRDEPVYRKIDLENGFVWDLLGEERLLEKVSSWTLSEEVAKAFNGGVPPGGTQGVVFKVPPEKGRTVLNISRLFGPGGFRYACLMHEERIIDIEYGIQAFDDREKEILIEIPALYPREIFSFGGHSSGQAEIIHMAGIERYGRPPTPSEQAFLIDLLEKSGSKLGPAWLSEKQVENVRNKLNDKIALLRQKKSRL